MREKTQINLGDIQKTLLLPLWGRAVETRKENPLLIDEKAVEIINELDWDFSAITGNIKGISQLGWVMRSLLIDKAIKKYITGYPQATIVNIGCGFDTTFERVDNGKITWYDLDLPDVIELRNMFIKTDNRRIAIAASFLDCDWMKRIQPKQNVMLVSAGVLYYFDEIQVRESFKKMADILPGSELIFDATSPPGLKMANKMVLDSSGINDNVFLKWGLKDAKDLLSFDNRIEILEEELFFSGIRKNLKLKDKLIAMFSDFAKFQYMVHIKFNN